MMQVFPDFIKKFLVSLSRNITRVYVIHWFLVVMTTNVILYIMRGTQELPIGATLILASVIFLITYPSALLWESLSNKAKQQKGEG